LSFVLIAATAFKISNPAATNPADKSDFTTNFKLVYEAAKKRFVSEKGAQASGFSSEKYVKKYTTTISFKDATVGIMEDSDQLLTFQILYSFSAATLDEAKAVKKEMGDWVKSLVPADYKTSSTYTAGYAGYMTDLYEYNSDIFAEISKRPVVRVGIIATEEGKYNLEILVSEPVFKTVDRPAKEVKK